MEHSLPTSLKIISQAIEIYPRNQELKKDAVLKLNYDPKQFKDNHSPTGVFYMFKNDKNPEGWGRGASIAEINPSGVLFLPYVHSASIKTFSIWFVVSLKSIMY